MEPNTSMNRSGLNVIGEFAAAPVGRVVDNAGDQSYRIENYDAMPSFFVSLTSPSDHWVFLSTSGGITAGRKNADHAIFPYGTSDRVSDSARTTGAVTVVLVEREGRVLRWEPFAREYDGIYRVRRNVEKNTTGNILTFEEVNSDLSLLFRQSWTTSPEYGLVRHCSLQSTSEQLVTVRILDGIQNTLPALTTAAFQGAFSNLLDAYKRNELLEGSGLGVFGLSAVPTDTAEPSEALLATTWWQSGLSPEATLLSSAQIDSYRRTGDVQPERDVKGRRGAYVVVSSVTVGEGMTADWLFCGEVDQSHAQIEGLDSQLRSSPVTAREHVLASIDSATARLRTILSRNDGIQVTGNPMTRMHHASNVTYNVMRGGYFAYDYAIPVGDFRRFALLWNRPAAERNAEFLDSLPATLHVAELRRRVDELGDTVLSRLALEYLPLTFSRRHGDPTRPWNSFSIETEADDGTARLAYQGNWRDIFQNWEALLRSSPLFIPHVIAKFLNATTVDGYNPYRVTDAGIDWERPDPDSPWANIGYWGDHQIIYLQKLLELSVDYLPGTLEDLLAREVFVFADVPYRLAGFAQMLEDPYNTITFDQVSDRGSVDRVARIGSDGLLVHARDGSIVSTNMVEKFLLLALAKASNFVPDGGIWMNTQRPEWNDANNALVGKGVSVVTTAYLERFAAFIGRLLQESDIDEITLFEETAGWMQSIGEALSWAEESEGSEWTASSRLAFMQRCGAAADAFREQVFTSGGFERRTSVSRESLAGLFVRIERFAGQIVRVNKRNDELFHAYNTLAVERNPDGTPTGICLYTLYEMLEGQVAALSAASVDPDQSVRTLEAMPASRLYRADQHSYMLYPNRDLPCFMDRNTIDADRAARSHAVQKLLQSPTQRIITLDERGRGHFDPAFRNARLLRAALADYRESGQTVHLGEAEEQELLALYEETFQHQYFTGRSGTFFGYEGLGSIYWHMVSKLILAVQENAVKARQTGDDATAAALRERYYDVRAGIGFNKSPEEYGAFPMDPYSHTPFAGGAKQPGMTGQVKEEIISRFGELGLFVSGGKIRFDPFLIRDDEYCRESQTLRYVDVGGTEREINVPAQAFAFTFCQTPVVLSRGETAGVLVLKSDGRTDSVDSLELPVDVSLSVFAKRGEVDRLVVTVPR